MPQNEDESKRNEKPYRALETNSIGKLKLSEAASFNQEEP